MAFFGGEADEIKKLKRQIGTQGERGCSILTISAKRQLRMLTSSDIARCVQTALVHEQT